MKARSILELAQTTFPEPGFILYPWLRDSDLVLLYAKRGLSKTFLVLKLLHSLASGQPFLKWQPKRTFRVLMIDGEMGLGNLMTRFWKIDAPMELTCPGDSIKILSFEDCKIDIANRVFQKSIKDDVEAADIIIIDNLLTCSAAADRFDDDFQQWARIQEWLIGIRSFGKCVLLVHHAGKSGDQLGTSMRENIMDTVIHISGTAMPLSEGITSVEWHFTKTRNFFGNNAQPLIVDFNSGDSGIIFSYRDLKENRRLRVIEASKTIKSKTALAAKFGIPVYEIHSIIADHFAAIQSGTDEVLDDLF